MDAEQTGQATPVGAGRSACAGHVTGPTPLSSFGREMKDRGKMQKLDPLKGAVVVFLVYLVGLLTPFAMVGRSWGSVWVFAAAPASLVFEAIFGIDPDSYFLIAFSSILAAAFWAFLGGLILTRIRRP